MPEGVQALAAEPAAEAQRQEAAGFDNVYLGDESGLIGHDVVPENDRSAGSDRE
jgi:hypothetical protein